MGEITHDLPFDEYIKLSGVNYSRLKLLSRSPAHFMQVGKQDTTSLKTGRAFHSLVLEDDTFHNNYLIIDKCRRDSKIFLEKSAEANGREILWTEDYEELRKMADAVIKHDLALGLINGSATEVTLTWEEDGFQFKARLDSFNPELETIIDLKTTMDASLYAFEKSAFFYGYHLQAYWYLRAAKLCGLKATNSHIIAIEKEAPYGIIVYQVGSSALAYAEEKILQLLDKYKYCMKVNKWPCYPDDMLVLDLPKYVNTEGIYE